MTALFVKIRMNQKYTNTLLAGMPEIFSAKRKSIYPLSANKTALFLADTRHTTTLATYGSKAFALRNERN